MEQQPTRPTESARPGPSLPPILRYIAGAVAFGTLAAWLANGLACYHELWSWCGGAAYVTLAGLVALGVIGPLAWTYRERALRRASRGMWARSWGAGRHDLAATFGRVVKFAVEGEWPEENPAGGVIAGVARFERRGWWVTVPIEGGRLVWVDRWELWQWLIKVQARAHQVGAGESSISRRYWEPRIGRPMWMAYMHILETIGAVETFTRDPRSRRYVGGDDAWGWVEEYEKVRGSEER